MAYEPTEVAQQALDAAGVEYTLGDLEDGTRPAQVLLRAYERCLRQLLRAAHWDFARKSTRMVMLADSTGQTANVGSLVPLPWRFEYAYPVDCVKARFVPWNQAAQNPGIPTANIVPPDPTAPIMTGMGQPSMNGQRLVPARFVVTTDSNNLGPSPGYDTPGMSPASRTVICTNVQNAELVYTCMQVYPSIWDELFRAAFVSYVASEITLPLSALGIAKDKRFAMQLRAENIAIAKDKIKQARITDGNEGWANSDLRVDWMQARGSGNGWGMGGQGGAGPGWWWGGYDAASFGDGSSY